MGDSEFTTDLYRELQSLVQKIQEKQEENSAAAAYDAFASAAMVEIIKRDANAIPMKEVASDAWALADAMMEERERRGLGGFSDTDGDTQ